MSNLRVSLRPDYYEWFPRFSESEIRQRLQVMSFPSATLLTLSNIKTALRVSGDALGDLREFLSLPYEVQRRALSHVLRQVGLSKEACQAIEGVPREYFAPPRLKRFSYLNAFLPWNEDSGVSPPGTVALMLDLFPVNQGNVIEIGIGSGYHAACLAVRANGNIKIKGYELNQLYAASGIKAVFLAGLDNLIEISPEPLSTSAWSSGGVDGIYMTASGDIPGILKLLNDGGIIQRVRPIGEPEYLQEPPESWMKTRWETYEKYLRDWQKDYSVIVSERFSRGSLEVIGRLYDVSFVPMRNRIERRSAEEVFNELSELRSMLQ